MKIKPRVRQNGDTMKKLLLIMLACIMVATIFVGCNAGNGTVEDTTTAEETTAGEAPETPEKILFADLSKYEMIRPMSLSGDALTAFSDLMAVIRDELNVKITARDDFYKEGVESLKKGEFEILVGATNRDETQTFLSTLKRDEYGYAVVNGKIVIAGHTEAATLNAIKAFIQAIKSGDRTEVFFDNANDKFVKTVTYPVNDIKINGVSASEYTFVYPYANKNMENELALKFRDKIADLCGAYPKVVDDKSEFSGKIIVFGNASVITDAQKSAYTAAIGTYQEGEYYTYSEGDLVWVNAEDAFGLIGAVSELSSRVSKTTPELTVATEVKTASAGEALSVMSFNIYTHTSDSARNERVIKMINQYMPDIMGVQEASVAWMDILKSRINNNYAYVGVGRNGGNSGEYSAIFYLKDKFTVIESGTKWLSATPDVAGSKVSTSSYPRIMTYAIFERKSDGTRFLFVNTHLEHTNEESRVFQMGVLLEEIAKLPDLPTVVTGDFNCTDGASTYKKITGASFVDASQKAKNTKDKNTATFHNYGESSKRIDYIFASTGDFYIDSYEVCDDKIDGNYASDHHPIYAKISIIG